jgi:hypothetical protein
MFVKLLDRLLTGCVSSHSTRAYGVDQWQLLATILLRRRTNKPRDIDTAED